MGPRWFAPIRPSEPGYCDVSDASDREPILIETCRHPALPPIRPHADTLTILAIFLAASSRFWLIERSDLNRWSAHLMDGKKMQLPRFLEGVSEATAISTAVLLFGVADERRKRLAVNLRRELATPAGRWPSRRRGLDRGRMRLPAAIAIAAGACQRFIEDGAHRGAHDTA
jgi:hypothetical protein